MKTDKIHTQLFKVIGEQGRFDEIIIIENSNGLEGAIGNFRNWCVENKIKHNVLYSASDLPLDYVKEIIRNADTIAFETTNTYQITQDLKDYIVSLKGYRMKIIECYTFEPVFWVLPKGISKEMDMWILDSYHEDMSYWKIEKLKKSKS